jgi:hypothetical protein
VLSHKSLDFGEKSLKSSLYERIMSAAQGFRQRQNCLVDLAENIFLELATLFIQHVIMA